MGFATADDHQQKILTFIRRSKLFGFSELDDLKPYLPQQTIGFSQKNFSNSDHSVENFFRLL